MILDILITNDLQIIHAILLIIVFENEHSCVTVLSVASAIDITL
jgi:hypothetical protein